VWYGVWYGVGTDRSQLATCWAHAVAEKAMMIALLLLARELLGHRLGRELRGTGTLSPDPRECSSYISDLNQRTPWRSASLLLDAKSVKRCCKRKSRVHVQIVLGPQNRT
jgi:hypothetical protein